VTNRFCFEKLGGAIPFACIGEIQYVSAVDVIWDCVNFRRKQKIYVALSTILFITCIHSRNYYSGYRVKENLEQVLRLMMFGR
jgi:hypothetical protein